MNQTYWNSEMVKTENQKLQNPIQVLIQPAAQYTSLFRLILGTERGQSGYKYLIFSGEAKWRSS